LKPQRKKRKEKKAQIAVLIIFPSQTLCLQYLAGREQSNTPMNPGALLEFTSVAQMNFMSRFSESSLMRSPNHCPGSQKTLEKREVL
jgi:hypothetical protein